MVLAPHKRTPRGDALLCLDWLTASATEPLRSADLTERPTAELRRDEQRRLDASCNVRSSAPAQYDIFKPKMKTSGSQIDKHGKSTIPCPGTGGSPRCTLHPSSDLQRANAHAGNIGSLHSHAGLAKHSAPGADGASSPTLGSIPPGSAYAVKPVCSSMPHRTRSLGPHCD